MATIHIPEGAPIDLGAIVTLIKQGKTVISAEDSAIVELAMRTIEERKTATLYLNPTLFNAVMNRYWTPDRIESVGLRPIPTEQVDRIKSDFSIEIDGYANSLKCPRCDTVYSTHEFIEQGIKEHGEEAVKAVFSLKRLGIVRINPIQTAICQQCRLYLHVVLSGESGGYSYLYRCRRQWICLLPMIFYGSRYMTDVPTALFAVEAEFLH
jgi:uncharacterized C2H2 Zn-finger protein